MAKIAQKVFRSPYDQCKHKNGLACKVLSEINPNTYDFEEVGIMYKIQFEDGEIISAWPEELEDVI